ncbi:MAG: exosortase A [Terriglobia bacterium]
MSNAPEQSVVDGVDLGTPRSAVDLLWPAIALAALFVYLYAGILGRLVEQWWTDPNFSHGFFVPAFSAFLIWTNRRRLAAIKPSPAWGGLAVIALALALLVFGVLAAVLFVSRVSVVVLIAGLVIYFRGWRFFKAVIFPWAFLFLMIPPPTLVMNLVTLPLQFLASDLATWFLRFSGVPVLQNGNVIQLPNMALEVVEACSGIRSLVSLGTLAIIYGYLLETSLAVRIVLVALSAPIAVLANGLRIMGTGLTGMYWDPSKAQGFFHEFSGWVIFVLSLAALFTAHAILKGIASVIRKSRA